MQCFLNLKNTLNVNATVVGGGLEAAVVAALGGL